MEEISGTHFERRSLRSLSTKKKKQKILETVGAQREIQLEYSKFIVTKNVNKCSFFPANIKWIMSAINGATRYSLLLFVIFMQKSHATKCH